MSKSLLVTASQVESVRKMANEKNVGRAKFQGALDDGRVSRFLDDLKTDGVIAASVRRLNIPITLPAQPACTVAKCFTDTSVFAYRDSDLDNWLPHTLPASKKTSVSVAELVKTTTEAELIKVGKPFTNLLQIEDLILRTEKDEKTGLLTNGYASIFFLKVDNSVFTVYAHRRVDGWPVRLRRFLVDREWAAELRFFSPAT